MNEIIFTLPNISIIFLFKDDLQMKLNSCIILVHQLIQILYYSQRIVIFYLNK